MVGLWHSSCEALMAWWGFDSIHQGFLPCVKGIRVSAECEGLRGPPGGMSRSQLRHVDLLSCGGLSAVAFAAGVYVGSRWLYRLAAAHAEEDGGAADAAAARKPQKKGLEALERLADEHVGFKMVLCVRNDLKMGKGKIAAQCSHATLGIYRKLVRRGAAKAIARWEESAQVKVVLRLDTEEEMLLLQSKAEAAKVATHITVDAGRTQIAPNSRTVMAVLGPDDIVDSVTGHLKLL